MGSSNLDEKGCSIVSRSREDCLLLRCGLVEFEFDGGVTLAPKVCGCCCFGAEIRCV